MNVIIRRALRTALVAGGLAVAGIAGAAAASAAEGDVVDVVLGTDTSVDAALGDVTEALPDVAVDTPVDLPPLSTERVEAAVQAVAGDGGAVDSVVGADAPTQTTTDDLVDALAQDVQQTLDAAAQLDVPAVAESVTGSDALVDDAIEDGALDAVTQTLSGVAAGVDDTVGTVPVVQDTVDAVTGPDGLADDVLGADAPSAGTSDALVESVLEDVDTTVTDALAGDLHAVNDDLLAPDGLVDDAIEDGAIDSVTETVAGVAAGADSALGTGNSLEGFVEVIAGQEGILDDILGADDPTTGTTDELLEYVTGDLNQITDDLIDLRAGSMIGGVVLDDGLFDDLFEDPIAITIPDPGDGTTDPGDGTTDPGDGTTDPGDGTTGPGDGSTDPGTGTTDPGDGSGGPGAGVPAGPGGTPGAGSGGGGGRLPATAATGGIRLPAGLVPETAGRPGTVASDASTSARALVPTVVSALARTGADAGLPLTAGLLLLLGILLTGMRRRWHRCAVAACSPVRQAP